MYKFSELVIKYRKTIIFTTILITLVLGYCLKDLTINSDILSYLPQDDPLVVIFNEVGDKFGGNSLALVALESDDAFSHTTLIRVDEITRQFKGMDEISNVMSLTDILDIKKTDWGLEVGKLINKDNIPEDPEELKKLKDYALSKDMYRGNIISDDGRITVIIARLKEDADQEAIGRQMKKIVEGTRGKEKIYYGGIPFQIIFLTDIIQSDLGKLIPIVLLFVMGILFISFKSLRGVFLPLSCVLMSIVWVLGIMSLLKIPLTIVSDAMPVILVAVGSAYGIHMLSKYNEDVRLGDGKIQGIKDALSEVGIPILLAGITTLIGFMTFLSSNLSLIREFGVFTAIGVAFAMIISVTFLPAFLSFLKVKQSNPSTKEIDDDWLTRMMDNLGGFVLRNEKNIIVCCAVVAMFSLFMIPRLNREVNMIDYFKKSSEIRQAEEMMEDRLGGSIPIQILVKGDLKDPFVLKEMTRFEKFLEAQPDIHNPQSIADLICEMNWVINGHYTIPETREGVANLWFFIEGNEIMDQLVTGDNTEALIQAKLGTVNTKQILALVNTVDNYINQELRTDLVTLQISLALPEFADELAKERTERILSLIDWDIRKRGIECNACITQIEDKIFAAVSTSNNKYDDALIDSIAMNVSDNLRGESADIPIESEKIINTVVFDIGDALRHDKSSKENILNILKNDVPQALYSDDPDGLDYAAETITAIIKDEKEWSKVNRLIDEIKIFLPHSLASDGEFLGDLRDDVWEINEDWTAVADSKYANLSGRGNVANKTKLSVQQTGMPIIYTDLDKKIIRSQVLSLSVAVLLVFIFLAYRLKSLVGGLISITPILLTILINFTIMSIFKIPLDIVTVLIGSVAVGIGIDYTIHFINRFKVELAKGTTELEALEKTLETTGKAIVINALSVMMGFLVLVLGNIVPLQRFGYLIALTMVTSAMASITILPALLLVTRAGFIGNFEKFISKTINRKLMRGGNQNDVIK